MIFLNRLSIIAVIVATTLAACQSSSDTRRQTKTPDTIALDPTITLQNAVGQPIKGSTATVYRLMENGEIRHIADWTTYLALGYQPGDILTVPDQELSGFPIGASITRWLTGETDQNLYLLQKGERYLIPDAPTFALTGGSPLDVTLIPDAFLATFPIADGEFPPAFQSLDQPPAVTATLGQGDDIWWATADGQIRHILTDVSEVQISTLPDHAIVTVMHDDPSEGFFVGTNQGDIWRLIPNLEPERIADVQNGWITALASDGAGGLWLADRGHYDIDQSTYVHGRGILHLDLASGELTQISTESALQYTTAIGFDPNTSTLWVGTRFHGLYRYDVAAQNWPNFTIFNSRLPDNHIHDLELADNGTLWLTTRATLSRLREGAIDVFPSYEAFSTNDGILKLAIADDTVWVASQHFIGSWTETTGWNLRSAFDHLYFLDDFRGVIIDIDGNPIVVGSRYLVYHYTDTWFARDLQTDEITTFIPGELPQAAILNEPHFPSPTQDYDAWLQVWPRPDHDNGRCMHYLQSPSGSDLEIRQQIARLQQLNVRWVLVNYLGPSQLLQMAPLFAEAGIMVIWRPFVRAPETYPFWASDVYFLRSIGLPPYIQIYNEPSLEPEWNDQPVSQDIYLDHLIPAVQAVFDAGGYVGLQHIQPEWTRTALQRLKAEGMDAIFTRLFFIPHPYGANHPPDYDEDINSVLGFTYYADIFEEEIGFVPVMIAGEGGWRPGQQDDTRFPQVSEELHRDFHVALFEWFQTGQLSNGDPLPDYLFAFCPWLLSDPHDPAAWFDSASGNRTLTIEAVEAMEEFERTFSWASDE